MKAVVKTITFGFGLIVALAPVSAQDWPQFLGPERNGQYDGPPLATQWPVSYTHLTLPTSDLV